MGAFANVEDHVFEIGQRGNISFKKRIEVDHVSRKMGIKAAVEGDV